MFTDALFEMVDAFWSQRSGGGEEQNGNSDSVAARRRDGARDSEFKNTKNNRAIGWGGGCRLSRRLSLLWL